MSRLLLILANEAIRRRALAEIAAAPEGSRVEIKGPTRTLPQSSRMWAMLGDIAKQAEHCGRHYDAEAWKVIFLHALGRETKFLPGLDGKTFVPYGQSSSDLSKAEMADLIEFIFAWGAQNGVVFHEPPPQTEQTRAV